MGLLKPAKNGTAYLKLGVLGFEGSGKTFTAVDIAIGFTKLTRGTKVAFFDTEKGSDFHIERFKKEGIQLDVVKSRSFVDLCNTIKEAEQNGYSFLIIDSITHVWRDLVASWLEKKKRNFLNMKDWGVLKGEWSQYTDLYVNSKISIGMLGRAGYEYDMSEDDDGNAEIQRSGTKMKVETETGFEPDLLLEMFKGPKLTKSTLKNGKTKTKKERGFINKCVVLKDRTDTMNAREIDNPKFKDFSSIIKCLNIGGEHEGTDLTRTSANAFAKDDFTYTDMVRRREIALEQIKETMILAKLEGRSSETMEAKTKALIEVYGTSSWTAISNMKPDMLEDCNRQLRVHLKVDAPSSLDTETIPF